MRKNFPHRSSECIERYRVGVYRLANQMYAASNSKRLQGCSEKLEEIVG